MGGGDKQSVKLPSAGSWVLPKPFSGTAEQNLGTFLRDYADCLLANGYVEVASGADDTVDQASRAAMTRMALFILKRSLQGPAAQALASLSDGERESRSDITKALEQRFGDEGKMHVRQAELYSRKRLPGESLTELGDAISILTDRAFPGVATSVRGSVGVKVYLDALSPDLRRRVGDFEPTSIREAVRKAVVCEAADIAYEQSTGLVAGIHRVQAETAPAAKPSVVDTVARLEEAQAATTLALTKLVERLEVMDRSSRSAGPAGVRRQGPRCWNCGQMGHFRRECHLNK